MYSATFGILWSDCTSTFIPFFSVFVATGNSGSCARNDALEVSSTPSIIVSKLPHHNLFMSRPYAENSRSVNARRTPLTLRRINSLKCFLNGSKTVDSRGPVKARTQTRAPVHPIHLQ